MLAAGVTEKAGRVRVLDLPAPRPPREDEVLLDVRAAGVGNWDELMRAGGWEAGLAPPFALGVEAAGVVAAAGSSTTGIAPGDEMLGYVFPFRGSGTWAGQVLAPAAVLAARPPGVSWAQAAALPVPALTAQQALEVAEVGQGRSVLVHGAGGVTGGLLVQFAHATGARVIATAGPGSADRVRGLGADLVVDYHDPAWPDQVRAAAGSGVAGSGVAGSGVAGGGVGVAVNAVPGGAAAALSAVADSGRLVNIAGAAPPPERGIDVRAVYVQPDQALLARAAALLARGALVLPIAAEFPLAQAAEAMARAHAGPAGAAVVLTP
jgi:NADPH:quinone reductase-like Zn-dependent oxidoreductase